MAIASFKQVMQVMHNAVDNYIYMCVYKCPQVIHRLWILLIIVACLDELNTVIVSENH